MVLGDLNSQTLAEVFVGEPYQKLRQDFIAGQVENSLCRNCTSLGINFD